MKNVVVVDLDGTLANIDHRLHLIKSEKPDWDAFFKACPKDKPNKWCVELIRSLLNDGDGAHVEVKIVSARSKIVEKETRIWLRRVFSLTGVFLSRHDSCGDFELFMLREAWDYTPDVDLKRKWLKEFGKDRILFVVDDRQRVVDMWREEGLTCLQCAAWPEWKFKREKDGDL